MFSEVFCGFWIRPCMTRFYQPVSKVICRAVKVNDKMHGRGNTIRHFVVNKVFIISLRISMKELIQYFISIAQIMTKVFTEKMFGYFKNFFGFFSILVI